VWWSGSGAWRAGDSSGTPAGSGVPSPAGEGEPLIAAALTAGGPPSARRRRLRVARAAATRPDSGGNVDGAGASAGVIPLPPLAARGHRLAAPLEPTTGGPLAHPRRRSKRPCGVGTDRRCGAAASPLRVKPPPTHPQPPVQAAPPARACPRPLRHRPWTGGPWRPPRHLPPFPTRALAPPRGPSLPTAVYRTARGARPRVVPAGPLGVDSGGVARRAPAPPPPPPRRPDRLMVATGPARQPRWMGSLRQCLCW